MKPTNKRSILQVAAKSPYSNDELVYNPNATFEILLDDKSEKVNKGLSAACKQVAELGHKDGNEHLALVDLTTGKIEYTETGNSNSVGNASFWEFISNNRKNYAFVHNHNSLSEFSETDLFTLTDDNSIKMFVISRYDGKIILVKSNDRIRETSFFDKLYAEELEKINAKTKEGIYTSGERTYYREKIIVDNAIRDFTKGKKYYG